MLFIKPLIKSLIIKLVPPEKWCRSLPRSQAKLKSIKIVYFCAVQHNGKLLTPIIWTPDPQLRRRWTSSVSSPGNVSYRKEILGVSPSTMFSASTLGCLLLWGRKFCLPFNTAWIHSVLIPLLIFILMFLDFPISSLVHLMFFFHYLSSSFFPLNLSTPSETNHILQIWNSVFLLSRHMEKNPLKQRF